MRGEERGFSLLETVIALGIFAAIGVVFLSAITTSTKATGMLDEGVQAEALARSHLEVIKECPYQAQYTPATCSPIGYIDIPFQFTVTIDPDCTDGFNFSWGGTCPDPPSVVPVLQRIEVAISREGRHVLTLMAYKRE